jgi:hypothetical protein
MYGEGGQVRAIKFAIGDIGKPEAFVTVIAKALRSVQIPVEYLKRSN